MGRRGRGKSRGKRRGVKTNNNCSPQPDKTESSEPETKRRKTDIPQNVESASNEDELEIEQDGDSLSDSGDKYDSDSDPAWEPVAEEPSTRTPLIDGKRKRGRPVGSPSIGSAKKKKVKTATPTPKKHLEKTINSAKKDSNKTDKTNNNKVTDDNSNKKPAQNVPTDKSPTQPTSRIADPYAEFFRRGTFLIEKKDWEDEKYPIWKVDSGRLLQKYEWVEYMKKQCHKAMCTYSSWQDDAKVQFTEVEVLVLNARRGSEIVQIQDEYRPHVKANENNAIEDDPLLDDFNIHLQVLLSQCIEPDFYEAIKDQEFYQVPLKKMEKLLDDRKKEIIGIVKWTNKFTDCLHLYPNFHLVGRVGLTKFCQASFDHQQPAVKSLELSGESYDRGNLQPVNIRKPASDVFLIGQLASEYVPIYHRLHHCTYHLFKKCQAKVELTKKEDPDCPNDDILDKCLHHRTWVIGLFTDFQNLLKQEPAKQ